MTNKKQGLWKAHRATYQCWQDMKSRCYNERSANFKNYGARGICVCDQWRSSFANFLADMGEKPTGLTLERINNDGNYEPSNCRWATPAEQRINQRTCHNLELNGIVMPLRHWAKTFGLTEHTLYKRIAYKGMNLQDALNLPIDKRYQRFKRAAIAASQPAAEGVPT